MNGCVSLKRGFSDHVPKLFPITNGLLTDVPMFCPWWVDIDGRGKNLKYKNILYMVCRQFEVNNS